MPNTEPESPSADKPTPSTSACCGGPAPVGIDACCVRDAAAKTAGRAGCGCDAPTSQVGSHRERPSHRSLLSAVVVATSLGLAVLSADTQDPLVVSPEAYRLEFENAWVKVVRVIYGPKAIVAPHLHTERASAYVYLNDGGPILFKHEGLPYAAVTRPATRAGSFRLYKGLHEVHSVENPTTIPSDFLRVEFKTEPREESTLKGKFFRGDLASATAQTTQFENAQVRVTRLDIAPGGTLDLTAGVAQPALLVALRPTGLVGAGGTVHLVGAGRTAWIDAGLPARLRANELAAEVLRFDFKSAPIETR